MREICAAVAVSAAVEAAGQCYLRGIDAAIVGQHDFNATALVALPRIEGIDSGDVGNGEEAVELRHVGVVDAHDVEAAHLHGALEEIGGDAVATLEFELVGREAREEDFALAALRAHGGQAAFGEAAFEKRRVVVRADAFEGDSRVGIVGFENAALG